MRKLVRLAREQDAALERGAPEQFQWLLLRRDDVTARLSKHVAAGIVLSAEEADEARALQSELAVLDRKMQGRVRRDMAELEGRRRTFSRGQQALKRYLTQGPRIPSFVDQRQ